MASPSDFPNIGLEFPPCDVICEQLTFFYSTEYPQYLAQASALFARENGIVRPNEVLSTKFPKRFGIKNQSKAFNALRHSTSPDKVG
jgi:hypothetical protein